MEDSAETIRKEAQGVLDRLSETRRFGSESDLLGQACASIHFLLVIVSQLTDRIERLES